MDTTGSKEARRRLPEILTRAHRDGTVTLVARYGQPYAAIVPVSQIARDVSMLTALCGSARGCYGDAAWYVDQLRDEWSGGTRALLELPARG